MSHIVTAPTLLDPTVDRYVVALPSKPSAAKAIVQAWLWSEHPAGRAKTKHWSLRGKVDELAFARYTPPPICCEYSMYTGLDVRRLSAAPSVLLFYFC